MLAARVLEYSKPKLGGRPFQSIKYYQVTAVDVKEP